MKRILYSAMLLGMISLASCEKEDIGGTATVALAGEWCTQFIDKNSEDGSVAVWWYEDGGVDYYWYYGGTEEYERTLTYNTSANLPTEMWIDDQYMYYEFKLKVSCDVNSRTFWTDGWVDNVYAADWGGKARVSNGKITVGGGVNMAGKKVDSIEYDIEFDDDDSGHVYHVQGFRFSGIAGDDPEMGN